MVNEMMSRVVFSNEQKHIPAFLTIKFDDQVSFHGFDLHFFENDLVLLMLTGLNDGRLETISASVNVKIS